MTTSPISGMGSSGAGVVLLPYTSGNTLLFALSATLITIGLIVLASFVVSRLYSIFA